MELFEQMRREYEHGVGTIKGVARKFRVHRRVVRDAIASAVPPVRKTTPRERPKLGPATAFIDEILQADRKAPRKQRHTAHRIWMRVRRRSWTRSWTWTERRRESSATPHTGSGSG